MSSFQPLSQPLSWETHPLPSDPTPLQELGSQLMGAPPTLTRCPHPCYCSVSRSVQLQTWWRSCRSHSVGGGGRLVLVTFCGRGGRLVLRFCVWAEQLEQHYSAAGLWALSWVLCTPQSPLCSMHSKLAGRKSGADESEGRGYIWRRGCGNTHRRKCGSEAARREFSQGLKDSEVAAHLG